MDGEKGRVIEETNELSKTRYFQYDAASRLVRRIDRETRVRDFAYDNLGRSTNEYWYANETDADNDTTRTYATETFSFTYDAAGQLLTADDSSADYTFTYDDFGRNLTTTHDITGLTPDVVTTSGYNLTGQRTDFDAVIGATNDFVNAYTYDNLGRMTQITQDAPATGNGVADKRVDLVYDALGRFSKITRYKDLAGGSTHHVADSLFDYDNVGRLVDLVHQDDEPEPNTNVFADYDFLFDRAGRLIDFDFTDHTDTAREADYLYDDTGQLTDTDYIGDWQTDEDYDYDANGNRDTNGYTVGTNNQMTTDGTYSYLYDDEGNRTARFVDTDTSGTITSGDTDITTYEWDHRNRLTKVTHYPTEGGAADKIFDYYYDFANRWVRKTRDTDADGYVNESRIFVHDGNHIALQFDKTGSTDAAATDLSHRYLHGPAIDQLLVDEQITTAGSAGTNLWPLTDHLGSVRDAIDNTGTIQLHRIFNAYGAFTATVANFDILFVYTSRPFDVDSGLQNTRQRWYDLSTGTWASVDPIGFMAGDANLYRYVANMPSVAIDPSGTVIQIVCPAGKDFIEWLEGAGVQKNGKWPEIPEDKAYVELNKEHVKRPGNVTSRALFEEIATEMIMSDHVFTIDGTTKKAAMAYWTTHVFARQRIIHHAKTNVFGFGNQGTKSDFGAARDDGVWHPLSGKYPGKIEASTLIDTIMEYQSDYSFFSATALNVIVQAGVLDVLRRHYPGGEKWFNDTVGRDLAGGGIKLSSYYTPKNVREGWIPGDSSYINTNAYLKALENPKIKYDIPKGSEGENIIYLGNRDFFGHTPRRNRVAVTGPLSFWERVVNIMGGSGGITYAPKRGFPWLGLLNR